MEQENNLILIDAYNLIYRAFYGNLSPMKNKEGLPTNAIYTVCRMLQKIRKENSIKYALCVFDGGGTFRNQIDENYKKNRKPMPPELQQQMPYIKQVFELLGWPTYQAKDVEADDVIATLATRAAAKNYKVYILSGDKDFRAIVNDNICVVDTMREIVYDEETIVKTMSIKPCQVVDYLSLVGDSIDNVIGIDKLGPKTAVKLLDQYGTLDNIIKNVESISGVVGKNLKLAIEDGQIYKNKQLISLQCGVEINLKVRDITPSEIKQEKWEEFCELMNFKSSLLKSKMKV